MAISRGIEPGKSMSGIDIPPARKLTTEQMRRAADELAARGHNWEHRAKAMKFFMDQGLKDFQAAALVGNFTIEAGDESLPSDVAQYSGGPGRGIAQWEVGRFDNLKQFARDRNTSWKDFDTQLEFVMHEFKTSEHAAYTLLVSATDVASANNAVLNGYERPAARIAAPRQIQSEIILAAFRKIAYQLGT